MYFISRLVHRLWEVAVSTFHPHRLARRRPDDEDPRAGHEAADARARSARDGDVRSRDDERRLRLARHASVQAYRRLFSCVFDCERGHLLADHFVPAEGVDAELADSCASYAQPVRDQAPLLRAGHAEEAESSTRSYPELGSLAGALASRRTVVPPGRSAHSSSWGGNPPPHHVQGAGMALRRPSADTLRNRTRSKVLLKSWQSMNN